MKTRTRTIAKVNPTPQQQVTTTLERKSISPEFTLSQGKAFSSANSDSNLSSHHLNQISPFRSAGQHIIIPREVDSKTVLEQLSIHNFSQAVVQNKPNKFITAINSISNKNSSIQRWGNPFKKIGKAIKKGFDWVKEKIVKPIKRAANRLLNGLKKQGKRLINRLKRAAKKVIGKAKRVILNFIRKIKRAVRKVILKAKRFATKIIRKAQSYARKIGRKVAAIAKKILTYARNLAKKYAQKMIKLTNYFLKIGNPQKAQKLIQRLNQFAGKIVDWATKKVMGLVRRATAIVNKVMQRATKQLSRLIQRTAGIVQRLVKKVTSFAQKLIGRAIKGVENLIQKAGNITHLFDKARSKLNGILGPARGKANWLINSMMKLANKILRGFLLPLAIKAGSWMRRLLRPRMRFVSRTLNKAASGIGKIIKRATNKLTQSTQWLIGKIKKLIELYTEKIIKPSLQMGATIVKRVISGVIKFIENKILAPLKAFFEFMNLISQILSKAAGSIDNILAHPVRFIKNLFSGVKQGFSGFISRIGMHLEKGLQTFLFGSLGNSGIEIPKTFDLSGLISVVSQVSGISYNSIRERAAGKLGEDKVAFIEEGAAAAQGGNLGEFAQNKAQGYADNQAAAVKEKAGPIGKIVDIFKLLKEGPAGIVKYFQELDFSSLITGIITEVKDYLIQEIVQKAVIQVISYLTPGAGWLKAAIDALRMMYALFVERAQQVKEFLDGFTDSVVNIAKNAIAPAVKLLESSLGKTLPLLIGVLADYLGIGGIPQKIKGFLMKGRKWVDANVMPIIDKILDKIAGIFAKLPSANIADYIPKGMGMGNLYGKLRQYFKPYTKKPFQNLNKARTAVNVVGAAFKPMGLKSLKLEPADSQGKTFNVIAAKPLPGRKLSPVVGKVQTFKNTQSAGVGRSLKINQSKQNFIAPIQRKSVPLTSKHITSQSKNNLLKSQPIAFNLIQQKPSLVKTITRKPILQKAENKEVATVKVQQPDKQQSDTVGISEQDRQLIEQVEKEVAQINQQLVLELSKVAADVAGVFDPTPVSDSISAGISVAQGEYVDASLSLLSWIPYVGDAVAKPIKFTRSAKRIKQILNALKRVKTKYGTRLKKLKGAAAAKLKKSLDFLKSKVDNALQKLQNALDKVKGKAGKEGTEKGAKQTAEQAKKKAVELPKAIAESKAVTETNDVIDTPVSVLLGILNSKFKFKYSWIKRFEARPKSIPGHYSIYMIASENKIGDYDDNEFQNKKGKKGKSFRGGKKKNRDNWYGYNDKNFQRWWHRQGKAEFGGEDIDNAEQAQKIYDYWMSLGKPTVK